MRKYLGTGTYIVGFLAVLCAAVLLNATLARISASPSPGYQTVRAATGETLSTSMKTVDANCPAGKDLLGGGAVVGYQVGSSFVTDPHGILIESEPNGANGWQATGIDRTKGDSWGVVVYAICARL
ncbi:MAG TPA: hypothetical protein VK587_17900 [bacterium]|nr:hypothetical protein [bacterium]